MVSGSTNFQEICEDKGPFLTLKIQDVLHMEPTCSEDSDL